MSDPFYYVMKHYCAPERHYHGIEHITRMLKDAYRHGNKTAIVNGGNVTWKLYDAILFHDVIYNIPKAEQSNEELSALEYLDFFSRAGYDSTFHHQHGKEIANMIRATEHHFDGTVYDDYLTNLLLDLDLMSFTDDFDDFYKTQAKLDAEFLPYHPKHEVIYNRRKFLKDIYDYRTLKFRVVDNKEELTEKAYSNIRWLLNFGG